ncbi:MAG TPA: AsmA-like C-terminal domain-containing protein [Sedimentisphaerales bacterium]|nr:AsmA-like C-terminal domain-containing protein [Sedimentisphaerales bacterium]
MPKRKIRNKGSWIRYRLLIAGGLILLTVAGIVITLLLLVPSIVRQELIRGLSRFCDGPIEVDGVDINYYGPIYIDEIKLFDRTGREWLDAKGTTISLTNWPSRRPVVTHIEVDGLNLEIMATGTKPALPLKGPSARSTALNNKFDLQRLIIKEAAITVADANGLKEVYDNLTLSATKKENFYNVLLNRIEPETSELLVVKGKINSQTFEANLSVQMKHTVQKLEMAFLFAALNIPKLSAEGKLMADLTLTGCLKEPTGLKPAGIISFDGWKVLMNDNIIAANLATEARVKDRRFDFDNLTATVCNGDFTGSFYIEAKQSQPIEFGGQILAQKMSFLELTSALARQTKKATKGTVTLNCNFTAKGGDLKNLGGEGRILLDDADISVIPIIPLVFRTIGLAQLDPMKMSDVECTFSMSGPAVTIKSAHVANRFAAIKAEAGGTINLQTEKIDMYVVAVPLKQIDAVFQRVPVVNIFANLKDKLTRLHIRGSWSDPPKKLIAKEPIKDIKDSTVGFLKDVVTNSGQISQEMLRRFGISARSGQKANN